VRALVTGAAGFIGDHLMRALSASSDVQHAVGADLRNGWPVDVLNYGQVFRALVDERIDTVFHLAAQFDEAVSWQRPAFDAEVNLVGTARVMEACQAAGVRRLVFASTVMASRPEPAPGPSALRSPYAISKGAAADLLWTLRDNPVSVGIAVLGNVFGPGGDNVVTTFVRRAQEGLALTLNGNPSRRFVYVDDVVAALMRLGQMHESAWGFVDNPESTTMLELASMVCDVAGSHAAVYVNPGPEDVPAYDEAWSVSRFGWTPTVSLRTGIERML